MTDDDNDDDNDGAIEQLMIIAAAVHVIFNYNCFKQYNKTIIIIIIIIIKLTFQVWKLWNMSSGEKNDNFLHGNC